MFGSFSEGKIVWEKDDEGRYYHGKNLSSSSLVYRRKKWTKFELCLFLVQVVSNPKYWEDGKFTKKLSFSNSFIPVYPYFHFHEKSKILEIFNGPILDKFIEIIKNTDINTPNLSDFLFLAKLGTIRNWKKICCICLTEDIMGTTCGCGHTEIAVFRPCGHAICAKPCFQDLVKRHNIKLETQTIKTANGMVFSIVGKMNIDDVKGFPCPMCNTIVDHTFRAEDIHVEGLDQSFYDDAIFMIEKEVSLRNE